MFKIWIKTAGGSDHEAFTWAGCAASGIEQAWKDAALFGWSIAAAWAVAL
jgi:hypothetical protein